MKYLIALSLGIMLAVTGPVVAGSMEQSEENRAIRLALRNLPSGGEGLSIGAGVGAFESKSALAAGASYGRAPLSFTLNAMTTSDGNVGVGVGVSWKFGK